MFHFDGKGLCEVCHRVARLRTFDHGIVRAVCDPADPAGHRNCLELFLERRRRATIEAEPWLQAHPELL